MEINAKPLILWILYNILGLDGFRIGNIESSLNPMQVDKTRLLRLKQSSSVPYVPANNKLKRFFEFNPVAFNRKSSIKPEQKFQPTFQFSPFITSLQNFKKNSMLLNEEHPLSSFKSTYINNGDKPKSIRPYVDHFSGVKSFTFHLKNPKKDKQNVKHEHLPIDEVMPSLSKSIIQTLLKPKTKELLNSKDFILLEHSPLIFDNVENDFENTNLKGLSPDETAEMTLTGNEDIILKDDNKVNDDVDIFEPLTDPDNIQSYATSFQNNGTFFKAITPKFKKFPEYVSDLNTDGDFFSFIDNGQDVVENTPNNDLHQIFPLKQHQNHNEINAESLHTSDVLNGFASSPDNGFDTFIEFTEPNGDFFIESQPYGAGSDAQYLYETEEEINNQGIKHNDMKSAHSAISMDDGFGDFGFFEDSTEKSSIPSNEASGFSDFKPVNAKPQFGVESLYYNDVIDPFEEGFGSFNSDDSDCDTIDTKSCVTNHDCSCYGLYQCHGNKCTTLASSSDNGIEQPSIGHWHDEPLDFGTWGK